MVVWEDQGVKDGHRWNLKVDAVVLPEHLFVFCGAPGRLNAVQVIPLDILIIMDLFFVNRIELVVEHLAIDSEDVVVVHLVTAELETLGRVLWYLQISQPHFRLLVILALSRIFDLSFVRRLAASLIAIWNKLTLCVRRGIGRARCLNLYFAATAGQLLLLHMVFKLLNNIIKSDQLQLIFSSHYIRSKAIN